MIEVLEEARPNSFTRASIEFCHCFIIDKDIYFPHHTTFKNIYFELSNGKNYVGSNQLRAYLKCH